MFAVCSFFKATEKTKPVVGGPQAGNFTVMRNFAAKIGDSSKTASHVEKERSK